MVNCYTKFICIYWADTRDAARHPTRHRIDSHNMKYGAQNVDNTMGERPCSMVSKRCNSVVPLGWRGQGESEVNKIREGRIWRVLPKVAL